VAGIEGKRPAIIAVAVAAELLQMTQGTGAAARKPLADGAGDFGMT
jgi:xanthine/CO dehydrogenase XdhC/CoxF family maturation factor